MGKNKQMAANMAAQTVSFAISMLVSFFLAPFVVGRIGKEVYGFVGLSNNVISYVAVFTAAINGMANRYITISYVKGDIKTANQYFTSVTIANIFVVAVLIVPAAFLIAYLEKVINIPFEHILDVKVLWAFVFAMFTLELVFGRMEVATFASNRLDLNGMRTMESNILKVVLLFGMYYFLPPRVAYVGISAFLCAIYVVLANIRYMKKLTPDIRFRKSLFDFSSVKEILNTGIWNSANQLSQLLFTGLDLLIANLFIGAAGMGLLSISKTLPIHILAFIGMIAGVFYPQMTITYAKGNLKDFLKDTSFATRVCGFVCSVPIMGILIFGKAFFTLWLPTLSQSEIMEIQMLSVLTVLPQVFSIYVFPLYQVNTLTCKLKIPSIVNISLGMINVIAVFLLLKFTNLGLYAIAGVSSLLLLLRVVFFAPMYAAANIKMGLWTFYPALLRGVLLNIVIGVVFYGIYRCFVIDSWLMLIIDAGVSAGVGYLLGLFILFRKEERRKILDFVRRKQGDRV